MSGFVGNAGVFVARNQRTSTNINVLYGYLYNWYVGGETNTKKITSSDEWRLPIFNDVLNEFIVLNDYIDINLGARYLKSCRQLDNAYCNLCESDETCSPVDEPYWEKKYTYGVDRYGFRALPGGARLKSPFNFRWLHSILYMWTPNRPNQIIYPNSGNICSIWSDQNAVRYGNGGENIGASIRLLRDTTEAEGSLPDGIIDGVYYTGNNGVEYPITKIGTQVWLAWSLVETKYRDGSAIPEVQSQTAWDGLTTGARCSYNNNESLAFTS